MDDLMHKTLYIALKIDTKTILAHNNHNKNKSVPDIFFYFMLFGHSLANMRIILISFKIFFFVLSLGKPQKKLFS